MSIAVIIVAGGKGTRMGGDIPKQYLSVGGQPILKITISRFAKLQDMDQMVVVAYPNYHDQIQRWAEETGLKAPLTFALPGPERQHSVANGLKACLGHAQKFLIHDAARPFVPASLIENCLLALDQYEAVVPVVPAKDSIKFSTDGKVVEQSLERKSVFFAQTPQGLTQKTVALVLALMESENHLGTDDVYFAEMAGVTVGMVQGDEANFKITSVADLKAAEQTISNNGY